MGIERLLPGSGGAADISIAARSIRSGLTVTALRGTNIILVSYKSRDPELATLVLKELLARYFTKHLEVHRSADAFNFVSQQSDEVRARLNQTEEELKRLKDKSGITSLTESTTNLNAELSKTREALQSGEKRNMLSNKRSFRNWESRFLAKTNTENDAAGFRTDSEVVQQYHALIARLAKSAPNGLGTRFQIYTENRTASSARRGSTQSTSSLSDDQSACGAASNSTIINRIALRWRGKGRGAGTCA